MAMLFKKINPTLIPIKLLYFLYYGGLASFIPYKSLYQKQMGMSTAQNGFIQAAMQLVSLFSPPIAGIITDKTKAYKVMLGTLLFFSIAFTIPFYFIPPAEVSINESIACCFALNVSDTIACREHISSPDLTRCFSERNVTVVQSTKLFQQCSHSQVNCTSAQEAEAIYGQTFAFLVVLTALMSFFLSPVTPLLDSSAMDILGRENVGDFGEQRLWGAVGFGIVALCITYLTEVTSPPEIYGLFAKNYLSSFCSVGLFWGAAMIVMVTSVKVSAPKAKGILKGLRKLLVNRDIIFFLFVVLISGFATGVQYTYLFWYLEDLKNFKLYILGLSVLLTCASEILMFRISGWVCKTFGYVSVLSIGLCAVSMRFFLYTVITDVWQILLIEWLHGISFALPMAAMCAYATVVAPKDAVATLISFSQTVYWGIGNMLGALLGGVIYQNYGGKTLFRVTSITCFIFALLYWICLGQFGIFHLMKSHMEKTEDNSAALEEDRKANPVCEEKLLHEEPTEA